MEDGTKLSERALGRRRHPPRIRRLCRDRRDGGRCMSQVCLLSVFATRCHGQGASLTTTAWGRVVGEEGTMGAACACGQRDPATTMSPRRTRNIVATRHAATTG